METEAAPLSGALVLLTVFAVLGGFLFGYDTGVVSGAEIYVQDDLGLSDAKIQVVVSVTVLFAALGSACAGAPLQRYGRKPVIMLASCFYCLGSLFVVQVEPETDDFRYTLIGTEITEHVGRDNTGRTVGDVFGASGLQLYSQVRDTRQPVRVWGVVDWLDKQHKSYETLVLPLAADGVTIDMLMAVSHYE